MNNIVRTKLVKHFSTKFNNSEINESLLFGSYSGNRLSEHGNKLMMQEFEHHKFPITEKISLYKKTQLNQNMPNPYYMSDKMLVLYDKADASSFMLIGDLSLWIESLID